MYNYKKLDSYALSGDDIKKILGRDVKIIKYPDFGSVDNIFDAFINNECVIFFETVSQMVGHWECMFYIPTTKTIHFFDSYGIKQDGAEKFINANNRN